LSWILGFIIFFGVVVIKQVCDSSKNKSFLERLKNEVSLNFLVVYTLVIIGPLQEELLTIFFEFKYGNTNTTSGKVNLTFAVGFLLLHVFLSIGIIIFKLFKNE